MNGLDNPSVLHLAQGAHAAFEELWPGLVVAIYKAIRADIPRELILEDVRFVATANEMNPKLLELELDYLLWLNEHKFTPWGKLE